MKTRRLDTACQHQDCIRDDDPDHHQETVMETGRQRAGDHRGVTRAGNERQR
ncbi:MAG: hypothetical protein KDJ31_10885 [Candidatus Competibacteraceae bacterium]|nr:hypothetical protein [Candidatus Competibacteraceae bacterium]